MGLANGGRLTYVNSVLASRSAGPSFHLEEAESCAWAREQDAARALQPQVELRAWQRSSAARVAPLWV